MSAQWHIFVQISAVACPRGVVMSGSFLVVLGATEHQVAAAVLLPLPHRSAAACLLWLKFGQSDSDSVISCAGGLAVFLRIAMR